MPDFEIDLGQAVLGSRKCAVCVRLQSSATFATSEEDDIDRLRRSLTTRASTDTANEKPWVRCGDSFKLVIYVQAETVLGVDEQDELREGLSSRLAKAKVVLHMV